MSAINRLIDQACGLAPAIKTPTWKYEAARQVLIELADDLVRSARERQRTSGYGPADPEANVALKRAAELYFDARMAVGIKSVVAFRRRAKLALERLEGIFSPRPRGMMQHPELAASWVKRAYERMGGLR
jgi:hypothetical protein